MFNKYATFKEDNSQIQLRRDGDFFFFLFILMSVSNQRRKKRGGSLYRSMYSGDPGNVLPFSALLIVAWRVDRSFGMFKS